MPLPPLVKPKTPFKPEVAALRALLETTLLSDRRNLRRDLNRLNAAPDIDAAALARLRLRLDSARARYAARAARVPQIRVDETLPIAARADEIVALIRRHPVLVLAGETGSGKSTQLPKLCLAAGRGRAGLIGCTQPRRMAARSVARRVASELGSDVGGLVGFQVRFAEQVGERSLIKFMTDGILLAETQSDPWLNAYDTIIVDEAHERSLNIDFLIGYLKRLLTRRRDLKLIVTSATIDTARFAQHFDNAPIVQVEGRSYPVEVRWRPREYYSEGGWGDVPSPAQRGKMGEARKGAKASNEERPLQPSGQLPPRAGEAKSGGGSDIEQIVAALDEITREDARGDALVFLSGEREIRDTHLALARRNYRATEVLPLYARLSAAEQDRVFKPGVQRRIVLATNVAETSLTVPRIRYVIDTGTARVKRYLPRSQLERLHIEPIAQAAAEQRKGRCGRVGPGICIRLYSEEDFAGRPRYGEPEILRSSLAGVILRMLSLRLGEVEKFPFVDMPNTRAIGDGYRRLAELGAVSVRSSVTAENQEATIHGRTSQYELTDIGRQMAELPIDVALARMLIEARRLGVARELLILVAFLSIQDPRERPPDARAAADAAHAQFADPKSDFVGVLNLWHAHALAHEELTQSKLRDWCSARFLSYLRMREWRELHRQLLVLEPSASIPSASAQPSEKVGVRGRTLRTAAAVQVDQMQRPHPTLSPDKKRVGGEGDRYEAVHRSLLAGWPTQVALKDEKNLYRGTRERRLQIFPGSTLARHPPRWLLAGQILDLQKVYAMLCASVEPEWIEQQAAHLVKRNWREPHWSRKRGAVLAFEQVALFGLILVEKRIVQFNRQDPAVAHAVFVREALVRGDIDCRADCVRANARVLSEACEIEAKQRRSGLVKDEDEFVQFFAGKLPTDISTASAFDAWYRKASPAQQAALRWPLDFVLASTPGVRASDFPTHLDCAGHRLKIDYRFVPGDPADGVTLQVPLAFVNAVPAALCEWLVPGLLADKVAELIRGLPKSLRRNFVPAPDFAHAFAQAQGVRDEPLLEVLANYLHRVTGVDVSARDFAEVAVPAHLLMRFRVYEDGPGQSNGVTLAEGRDIDTIRVQWGSAANAAFSRRADAELTREDIAEFDFDGIPERVLGETGLVAFPALVDLGDSVALRVFERADEARSAHVQGVRRLLRRALHERDQAGAPAVAPLPSNDAVARSATIAPPLSRQRGRARGGGDGDEISPHRQRRRVARRTLSKRHSSSYSTRAISTCASVRRFAMSKARLAAQLFAAAVEWLRLVEDVLGAYAELDAVARTAADRLCARELRRSARAARRTRLSGIRARNGESAHAASAALSQGDAPARRASAP